MLNLFHSGVMIRLFHKLYKKIKKSAIFIMKGKNIIFIWILSYLIITLISMICNGMIYSRAKKAVKNELEMNSIQVIDKFEMSVDNIFANIFKIVKSLQSDDDILRLSEMNEQVPYSQYSGEALSVSQKLQNFISVNPYISGIYIYYKNIDLVTGNNYMYSKQLFYEQNFKNSDLTYEEWESMFNKNSYADIKLISYPDEEKQKVDFYFQIPAYLDEFDAVAVLSIDTSTLLDSAKMVTDLYFDVGMFILSKDDEVIMTNGVVDSIPENSKDCMVISTVSDTFGWRYITVVPSKVFDKKLAYFNFINFLNIIICFILSVILSFFFVKMNIRPFYSLQAIYNNHVGNDMLLINNVLDDYRSAKQVQSETEKSRLLEMLISTGAPEILDELKEHNIDFPYQYFCVILFKLMNVSELFEDENDVSALQKYDSIKFIMKNVLEEIINEKHNVYICKINGQIVALVNINHDYMLDFRSDLEEMLNRGKEFVSNYFAFSYTPFVGGIHDVKMLNKSYREALNALQYRTFISMSDIVFCDDSGKENKTSEVSIIIPEEKTKQLINLLRLRDEQTSLALVNSLLLAVPQDSPIEYRVFLFDLISVLLHVFVDIEDDDVKTKLSSELCGLVENYDVEIVSEKINEIITEFCRSSLKTDAVDEIKGDEIPGLKKDMVSEIKEFIDENYTNQALNVAMIGEYFNITPYYISNIFKKRENISMLDYISKKRVENAKKMLVTTEMNLETIALQCGFTNIRTFMRVFQKYEIVTPGKYKELNKK